VTTDDVDEIAVERACNGDRTVSLNRHEMAAAVALHQRRGVSLHESADLLGMPWRSIQRIRSGDTALPHPRQGVTVDNTKEKIATALKSESITVRRAALKANDALAHLDTVLADWDAKQMARDRVAELEKALAEAKAALHGPKRKAAKAGTGVHSRARAWAQQQGIVVPPRGLVAQDVIDAWRQATGSAA
jgi:hypothetical protein